MSKTYLGYGYTNENGVATLDYDPNGEELPRRSYQCRSRTATVVAETTVEGVTHSSAKMKFCEGYVPPKPVPTLSLSGSDIDVGDILGLSGVLSAGSGKSVKVYRGNVLIDTVTTGSGGAYSTSVSELGAGTYTFRAEFEGDDEYSGVVSSDLEITVSKLTPTISLTGSDISVGETLSLSGVLSAGSGYSVKVYQGSSLVDTVTTGTGGAFTSNISNLDVGSYGFYAEFEGDGVYEEVVSSNVQITVSKITPTISLNGSDITFGEPLNLSGTLSVGSGKTVKIYKTNVLMDTVTTGSEGAFTSTLNNIDAGTYEFRAVFEGDSTYEEAISSKSIHISKLQPTITFTGSNITVGETLHLSGTLSIGNGHSVKIYQGETVIDTVTTGANGAFNKSITGLTAGTYTFKALFEGETNYQGVMSSAVSITVSEVQQSLAVSVDKSVLSYYDTDSATITATLSNGSTPISGETVTFKNGSTVLGTDVTDANGVAEYTYNSQSAGEVTITAEYGQLSDDVTIEDIPFARMTEYSCTKTSGNVKQQFFDNNVSLDLPNDFELELEFWSDGSPTWNNQEQRLFVMPKSLYVEGSQPYTAFFIGDTKCGEWEFGVRREGSTSSVKPSGFVCEQYQKVKFKRQTDNRIYLYLNDATTPFDYYQLSDAFNYHDWSICFHLWYDGTVKIRNIKLMEL